MAIHDVFREALLPFSAEQMYALINDIESYPAFMEGCVGAEVLSDQEGVKEARLDLQKAGFKQSFSTRNRLYPPHRIEMELLSGPFKSLSGVWTIRALSDEGCKVTLQLRFESNTNSFMMKMISSVFEEMVNRQVDAIAVRAKKIYSVSKENSK